jgi:PKD repeat protein
MVVLTAVHHYCTAMLHTVILTVFNDGNTHSYAPVILMVMHIAV